MAGDGVGADVRLPVQVSTPYERFPATIKGAFVMRGADGLPHVVRLEQASIERLPRGPSRPIVMGEVVLDVAPARDLFVPFEAPAAELAAGWYEIRSVVLVDEARTYTFAGRPFVVPWGRDEVREGAVAVRASLRAGAGEVVIDRIDMRTELAEVTWREPEDGSDVTVLLLSDGELIDELPEAAAGPGRAGAVAAGRRRSLFYPVPAAARTLGVVARLPSGEESSRVEVAAAG